MLNHHTYNTLIQITSTDRLCVKNYQLKILIHESIGILNTRNTRKNTKIYENIGHIKLVTNNANRKKLVLQPNYQTCKHFSNHLMAIEMKTQGYI